MNTRSLLSSRLRIRIAVLLALAAGVALVPHARAQTSLTWTGGSSDGNWGAAANWGLGTTPTFNTSTDVTFGSSNTNTSPSFLGVARTIRSLTFNASADGNVTIRLTSSATGGGITNLTFEDASGSANLTVASGAAGNFTIGNSSGSVVLSSNLTVDHNGNGTLTIDRPITGTGMGITKNGTGTLILSEANSFTGGLTINTGTVTGTHAGAMGTASNTVTFGGAGAGVLNLQNDTGTTFTALMNVASANGTVLVNRATSGAGVTHTIGATTLGGGYQLTVQAGSNFTSGQTAQLTTGAVTLTGNATLNAVNTANASTILQLGALNDGGTARTITLVGNGTVTLGTAATSLVAGSGFLLNSGTLRGTAATVFGSATINASGGTVILARSSVANFGGNFNYTSGNVILDRTTSGTALTQTMGSLSIGSATLAPTIANFTTAPTLAFGSTSITGNAVLDASNVIFTLGSLNAAADTSLTTAGNRTVGAASATTLSGNFAISNNGTGVLTLSGGITGTGNLTLNNNNSTASGITIQTASANNTGTITNSGNGSGSVLISGGVGSNVTNITQNSSTSNLTVGAIAMNGAGTTLVNNQSGSTANLSVTGGITGSGNLTLNNDSSTASGITIQTASANNTGTITNSGSGTGSVTISGGVGSNVSRITQNSSTSNLTVGAIATNSAGTTLVNNQSGSTANLSVTGGITGSGNLTLNNDSSTARGITISTASANNTGTITNSGSGTGSVTISGGVGSNVTGIIQNSANSTLLLSGASGSYNGSTTISAGTLQVGQATALGANTATVSVANGAVLDVNGTTMTGTNALTLRGAGSGNGSLLNTSNTAATYAGGVTLASDSTIGSTATGNTFTVSGGIGSTGTGNLTLRANGTQGITLSSTANNTGTITNSGSGSGSVLISGGVGANVTNITQNSATSALTLNGTSTNTGNININAGTLQFATTTSLFNNSTASWTASKIKVASGGTLMLSVNGTGQFGTSDVTTLLTNLGGANGGSSGGFAAGSAIGFDAASAFTVSNNIADTTGSGGGSLGLTKTGANSLILTGDSTYTGATTINAGTLQLGNNGATGSLSASSNITINSGTLTVNRSGVTTISNRIFLGNGSQTISVTSNSSTFSGDISSFAGATSALTLQATTTRSITLTGNLTVNGSVTLGSSSPAVKLSGNNSASSWIVNSSSIELVSAGAMGYSGNINMGGGGLVFTNNSTDVSSRIVIGSGKTYRLGASNSFTINSALTANGVNALNVWGAGTLVLGNSNSSFTGAVTIESGTLSVARIGNTGSNSYLGNNGSIIIGSANNRGTLLYTGTGETTDKNITVAGGQYASIEANNSSGTLRFTSNVTSAFTASQQFMLSGTGMGEIAGSIGNNGTILTAVNKSGTGIWTLSGNNTYTGATSVSAGTLVFRNTAARPTSSNVTISSGVTVGLGVGAASGDYSENDVATLFNASTSTTTNGTGTFAGWFSLNNISGVAVDTTAGSFTLNRTLSTSRALTKLGNNTLTLGNGSNSYSGATTIAAGTLSVASIGNSTANSAVGSGSAINIGLRDSSGTLLYTGNATTTNRTINLSGTTGGAVIDQSGTGLLRFTSAVAATGDGNKTLTLQGSTSGTGELSGVISDFAANTATTALVKAGTGIWTLSGTNTYTGGTTLSAGILGINATAALGTSGNITFSGGTMQFASGGSGANYGDRIKNSASAMILDTNGQSVTFSTAMDSSNTAGLTKNGSNKLSLSAANTYTGGTTINAGTLALSGASGSVAGAIAVGSGAALQLAHTADTSIANNISGVGNIVHTSSSATTLAGTNTNTGSIQSTDGGTLRFSGAGALSSNITGLSASGGSTLSFADGDTRTITLGSSGISLSTAKLSFDVDLSSSASDRLNFTAAASLNNSTNTVNLSFLNALSGNQTWTLLTAAGGLNGTWSLGTYTPQTGYSFSLTSNTTSLWLTAAVSSSLAYWTGGNGSSWVDTNFSTSINGTASIAGSSLTDQSDVIFAGTNAGNLTTTLGANYSINTLAITTPEVAINGSNTLNVTSSSSSAINVSATGSTTINASLAGTGAGLLKEGNGTLILGGSNSYAGGTSITGGTVVVGSSTAFGNSTGAVTLNPGAGNTTTLRSGASGLTLANNVALSTGTTVFDTNSNNTILSGVLSSLGALNKTGAGTLTLTGNNTHTGGITISAGGIALSGSGALADSEAVNLDATGTSFDISAINASGETIASIAGVSGSSIALGSKTLTVGGDNTSTTFSGSLGGTGGALVKTGSGTLTLDSGNTYTGTTTISAGGLQIGNGATTGSLSTSSTITNNGILTFNRSNNVAQGTDFSATAIGGSGSLVQSGTGNLTLSSANTYSGGTTLNSGTLVLNNSTAIGTGALTINGGTLNNTSGASITLTSNNTQNWNANFAFTGTNDLNLGTGAVALGNSASRTITLTSGNLTVGGVISGVSSSLTKAGAGTLRLTGSNSYSGGTTISAGILEIAGSGTLNGAGNIVNNGTLLWNSSGNTTFSGIISGSGGITLNGTGRIQLNSSNSFTGGVVINAGTLRFGGSSVISASNNVTINGGTLDADATGRANTISLLTLASGNVSQNTLTATNGYILQNGSVSAILAGTGTLTKNGSGTVTLSGINTISGTTTVSDGTLVLSGNGTLGTSTISLTGGTLDLGGKTLTNTFSSLTGGMLSNGTITNDGGNYALQNGTVSAVLAGTNGLTKTGSGTTTLTGSNSYSGATTISAGNLSINAVAALGSTSAINIGNTGALIYTGASTATINSAISVTGTTGSTGTIRNNGGALTLTGGLSKNGTTLTFDSGTFNVNTIGISGSAANSDLVIDGATVNLNIANTYNGPTRIIDGGTLNANVTDALPTQNGRTAISIDTTGTGSSTLALGASQSVASLTGAASSNVTLGSNTLTIGTSSGSTTYAGRITGGSSSALIKDGASTQVLTGDNTGFTGTTTISSGTLQAAAAGAMGNSTVINVTGGSFLVTAANAVSDSTNINLGGGTLAFGAASGNTTYAGRITGSGALIKDGASTQVLTGNNTGFTGTTTINSGTLQAAAAGAMGNSTVVNVTGGSFLVTAASAVSDSTNINLDGGRMAMNGNFSENVGLLTLSRDSIIDFSGFVGTLRFSGVGSWAAGANLAIWNWSGRTQYGTDYGTYPNSSNLVFTNNATLTNNLANISFYSGSGSGFIGNGFEVSGFSGGGSEIIAVPEPETYLTGVILLLGGIIYFRRQAKLREGHRPAWPKFLLGSRETTPAHHPAPQAPDPHPAQMEARSSRA